MKNMKFWMLAILGAVGFLRAEDRCSKYKSINCPCKEYVDKNGKPSIQLTCDGIKSEDSLRQKVKKAGSLDTFVLNNLHLTHLPRGLFYGDKIWRLLIQNSTTMTSLAPNGAGENVFHGLENQLHYLAITNIPKLNQGHLKVLEPLHRLEGLYLNLVSADLSRGLSWMKHLPLREIKIKGTPSPSIEAKAFSGMTNLSHVIIQNNPKLTYISRDLFPKAAEKLRDLIFNGNAISSLSNDLFDGMPNLKIVNLSGNRIQSFSQSLFQPLLGRQIKIDFKGNHLHCDKRILWMYPMAKDAYEDTDSASGYYGLVCYTPEKLKGQILANLHQSQLK